MIQRAPFSLLPKPAVGQLSVGSVTESGLRFPPEAPAEPGTSGQNPLTLLAELPFFFFLGGGGLYLGGPLQHATNTLLA